MHHVIVTLEKEKIENLVKFAEDNTYEMDDLLDMINGDRPIAGNVPGHVYETGDYRIVYSIENQTQAKIRHLSVSKNFSYPEVIVVEEIMKALGFKSGLEDCKIDIEKSEDCTSINIWDIY